MSALNRSVTVVNSRGLHARAAAKFVKLATTFDAEIAVSRNGQTVSGASIMGLMMLAASPGTELALSASGEQAETALNAICELIEAGFEED